MLDNVNTFHDQHCTLCTPDIFDRVRLTILLVSHQQYLQKITDTPNIVLRIIYRNKQPLVFTTAIQYARYDKKHLYSV